MISPDLVTVLKPPLLDLCFKDTARFDKQPNSRYKFSKQESCCPVSLEFSEQIENQACLIIRKRPRDDHKTRDTVPFIALVRGCLQICLLLLGAHRVPRIVPLFVYRDVITFRRNEHEEIEDCNSNQDFVSSSIQGFVVIAIYVLADHTARLNAHII